ncbi:allantoicase [Psychrobacter sp. LV10R520-6]|uniref:allantoicase n=1 Tax=Psychrobacter sp. LV10R520-6 TaxID=1415574 RepID=UPI0024CBF3A6|nr:allantoicase [Psychrobacter sp. LV10R520-6]SNT70358.1 allantoicase [Psychrobacter sp. LV10R520-6]
MSTSNTGQIIEANNLPETLPTFTKKTNVADSRLGAKALFATDDFFADKSRILNPESPQFMVGKFDDNGKWMDGWETRRKRHLGYDYMIIQLARPTKIAGLDIDTSHFTGNFPSSASVDTLYAPELLKQDETALTKLTKEDWDAKEWGTIVPITPLQGHHHEFVEIDDEKTVTHLRLNIYPDGGVARLRVYGDIQLDANVSKQGEKIDLAGALNGGRAIASNDAHFGGASNLLLPTKAPNMGDGWETRRRREPGNDWCIIALGQAGIVDSIDIDTAHFKGNFPDQVSIQAVYAPNTPEQTLVTQSMFWDTLLEPQKTVAHKVHTFGKDKLKSDKPITHIRVNIFPDGGLSRVRVYGKVANIANNKAQS